MQQKHVVLPVQVVVTIAVSALTAGLVSLATLPGMQMLAATDTTKTSTVQIGTTSGGGGNGDSSSQSTIQGNSGNGSNTTVTKTTDGNNGNSGNGNGSGNGGSNDCVIPVSQCSNGTSTCGKPPIFVHVRCNSVECTSNPSCGPAGSQTVTGESSRKEADTSGNGQTTNGNSNGNGSNNNGNLGASSSSKSTITKVIGNALGCFDMSGNWVTDRSKCDPNQERHFVKSTASTSSAASSASSTPFNGKETEIQHDMRDHELQLKFEHLFHTQTERDNAYAGLVSAVSVALQHVTTLSQQTLPEDISATVSSAHSELKALLSDLSSGEPTVSEIANKTVAIKAVLESIHQAVVTTMQPAPLPAETLTDPLDKVINGLPNVFVFLAVQGVTVSADSVNEYKTATSIYTQTKPHCLVTSDACLQLQSVISHLDAMRTGITKTLEANGRTDLEPQIDEMLQ